MRLSARLAIALLFAVIGSASDTVISAGELEDEAHELLVLLQGKPAASEQFRIAERLQSIGPEAREAVPWLLSHLNSFDSEGCLRAIGPEAAPSLATELVSTDDLERQTTIVRILNDIGRDARFAASALIEVSRSDDPELRFAVAQLLATLGRADVARQTLPQLLRELAPPADNRTRVSHPNFYVAQQAAGLLAKIDPQASRFVPELARAAKVHPSPEARLAALRGLVAIDQHGDASLSALVAALDDTGVISAGLYSFAVKWHAANEFGRFKTRAIGPLLKKLDDQYDRYHDSFLSVLLSIGESAGPAAKEMVPLLRREMNRTRKSPDIY